MENKNIISPYSMELHTKNQLLRELLDGISLDDLRMLVDLKKKMHSTPRKNVKQMTQDYEANIIAPPFEFRDESKPVPLLRAKKTAPIPLKSVKQMVKTYEDNIIAPPIEFQDKPIPMPRTKPKIKPIPLPRTRIEETDKALKGYTSSYKISIKHSRDPLLQLQNTRIALGHHISKALSAMKGLKFIETLKVTFLKAHDDGYIYIRQPISTANHKLQLMIITSLKHYN